jgi:hypothetical protein
VIACRLAVWLLKNELLLARGGPARVVLLLVKLIRCGELEC